MSGDPKLLSSNTVDSKARPVLMPGGNQAKSSAVAQKPVSKPLNKTECLEVAGTEKKKKKKKAASSAADLPRIRSSLIALSVFRRHDLVLQPNLLMSASCSSDASTDSFCSQSSTGRIGRTSLISKQRQSNQKIIKIVAKVENDVPPAELFQGMRKCTWVMPSIGLAIGSQELMRAQCCHQGVTLDCGIYACLRVECLSRDTDVKMNIYRARVASTILSDDNGLFKNTFGG